MDSGTGEKKIKKNKNSKKRGMKEWRIDNN
jgi:hypothetical protein